jgi:hypothetical protein
MDYNLSQQVDVQIEGARQVSRPYLQIILTVEAFKIWGWIALICYAIKAIT